MFSSSYTLDLTPLGSQTAWKFELIKLYFLSSLMLISNESPMKQKCSCIHSHLGSCAFIIENVYLKNMSWKYLHNAILATWNTTSRKYELCGQAGVKTMAKPISSAMSSIRRKDLLVWFPEFLNISSIVLSSSS